MGRRRVVDYPVELISIDSPYEFEKFLRLGEKHTSPLVHRVTYGKENNALSLRDALSVAYLHGVWHGYQVAEKVGGTLRSELAQQKLALRILE